MPPTSSSPGRSRWFDSPFPEACSGLGGRLCRDRKPRFVHSLLLGSTEDATPEFRIEPMFPPALAIDNAPSSQDGPSIPLNLRQNVDERFDIRIRLVRTSCVRVLRFSSVLLYLAWAWHRHGQFSL